MEYSIRLNLKPIGGEIEKAGLKSSIFLKSHGFSDEAVDTQIMILRELITSGIKYGKLTPSEDEITVNIFISEKTITFEVKNPVDDTCQDRLKELDKTIQFIRGYQDPFEPYLIKQREAAINPSSNGTNELGLARVAYEGGAMLDFFVGEDNFMNLFAVRNLD
jgi:hypothetical protein